MGSNVFGTPITDETLKGMTKYHDKVITNMDRAQVALEMKNADGKDMNARKLAENLRKLAEEMNKEEDPAKKTKEKDGTLCLIYNATGGALKLAAVREWNGHVSGAPYPMIFENGQWAVFYHEKVAPYSVGAIVYEGNNAEASSRQQYVLTWRNMTNESSQVYAEIRGLQYFSPITKDKEWNALLDSLNNNKIYYHKGSNSSCVAFASMSNTDPRAFEGILSVEGVL